MSRRYEFEGNSSFNSIGRYKVRVSVEQSKLMEIKKAPKNQFVKYLDDTDNVFYQDRKTLKRLKQIKENKPVLLKFTIYLLFSFLIVWSVSQYQKPCPENAWCGAYVHCNQNYILTQSQTCDLDPLVIAEAKEFVYSIVQNIKYNHGNQQCWPTSSFSTHKDKNPKINQILDQNKITKNQIRIQIWRQFSNQNNQKILNFQLNQYGQIFVMQKKYSYSCQFYLFSKTKYFFGFVIFIILICLGLFFYYKKLKMHKKALQVYLYLHERVKKYHKIDVKEQLKKIQGFGQKLNSEIWILVDNERVKRAQIVYYQDITLKWKLLI